MTFLLLFSIYHNKDSWIIKYTTEKNVENINGIAYHAIIEEPSEETYRAFCRILHINLRTVLDALSRYDRHTFYFTARDLKALPNREDDRTINSMAYSKACSGTEKEKRITRSAIELIEEILPDPTFCAYVASREY